MTQFKCSQCCATYTSQKSLRQHCRAKHGARISCQSDGCTYTRAKSRHHLNNVYPILGRGYAAGFKVSNWKLNRPGKKETIRRMRKEQQPEQGTSHEDTGDHVGRMSMEKKMDHSDSNSERIDMQYGINDLSLPESTKVAEPLCSSQRRVVPEISEDTTQPQNAGDKDDIMANFPNIKDASARLNNSETNVSYISPPSCQATASHPGKENPLLAQNIPRVARDEALLFLTFGGMPLYPPAMRNWSEVEEESVLLGRMLRWPPRNWSTMTADAKLMLWEMAALTLEKELNTVVLPHRNSLLEKYNFLALPDTAQPMIVDGENIRYMRFRNFCTLQDIATSAEDPNCLLESFRKAAEVRDQSTDNLVRVLQGIRLYIKKPGNLKNY